jgi:hypothetical protein
MNSFQEKHAMTMKSQILPTLIAPMTLLLPQGVPAAPARLKRNNQEGAETA